MLPAGPDAIPGFIRRVVAERCSMLPIRLYNTSTRCFTTRSELSEAVTRAAVQDYQSAGKPPLLMLEELAHKIKRFVLHNTRYAVLSHTWGPNELSYQRLQTRPRAISKDPKFVGFSKAAAAFGCNYIWIDTACIDKSSSSELDESIRSMFTWYRQAYLCIVYLEFHAPDTGFTDRWFTRGWTLQELLAPKRMVFLGRKWERILPPHGRSFDIVRKFRLEGYRAWAPEIDLETYDDEIYQADGLEDIAYGAGISEQDMATYEPSPTNASRMFMYMCDRETTVAEDAAYCLLGLLGIILPTAYGEGRERALYRLQVACAEQANERNIFIWDFENGLPSRFSSMLPRDPFAYYHFMRGRAMRKEKTVVEIDATELWASHLDQDISKSIDLSFSFTNAGLRIAVTLHDLDSNPSFPKVGWSLEKPYTMSQKQLAILGTFFDGETKKAAAILLERVGPAFTKRYRRLSYNVQQWELPSFNVLLSRVPEIVYIL